MPLSYSYEDSRPSRDGVTFEWDIVSLKRKGEHDGHSDVVFEVEWKLTVSEVRNSNTYKHQTQDTVSLEIDSLSNPIEYSSLTETDVVSWVKARLNTIHFIDGLESDYITRLEDQMISQLRTGVVSDNVLPWS